jgi:hypothetical protein
VRLTSAYVGGYGGSRYTDSRFPEALTKERETAYFAAMRTLDPQWRDKKYIVTEFGIRHPTLTKSLAQTKNSTDNAYMRTFDFSLSLAAVCMTEVAMGIDAASLWVLHDIYYSQNHFMKYGLWGFKDEHWQPRPAWYAYSLFTRFMTRGSRLSQIEVNGGEDLVTATLAQGPEGCFLFVLNQSYGDVALAAEIASPTGHWVRYTCDESVTQAAADRPLFEPSKATPYSGELRDRVPRRSLVVYQLQ